MLSAIHKSSPRRFGSVIRKLARKTGWQMLCDGRDVCGKRAMNDDLAIDAGFLANEVVLSVDHELMRNLILSASAGYAIDDYENIDREDERYAIQLAATWLINQLLSARLEFTHEDQDTDGTATGLFLKDYTTNEIMVTLTAER